MPNYFDLEVSLAGVEPRIWRRFLLKDSATFRHLHEAIQDACGWEDGHLYEFRDAKGKTAIAGAPYEDPLEGECAPADNQVRLASHFARKGTKCIYRYDFGDCWDHLVELKAVVELPERFKRRLVGGQRAFPPEDCGGIWGYDSCLKAVGALKPDSDDDSDDLEERREWLGDWNPEAFDLASAKKDFDC